jgi:hypothetical protein
MAGSVRIPDEITGATVTSTVVLKGGQGGHRGATFYFDVTAVTGTWEVQANWAPTGVVIPLALASTITATGMKLMTLQAPFTTASNAIPEPTSVLFTETVAGSITGKLIIVYSN